ncbi:MAG: uracil-DNA glycosylase family protein [Bacteroidota bacterium]
MVTGKSFYSFLISLKLDIPLPKGFSVINPYGDYDVKKVLRTFCDKYYGNNNQRVLVLGINPGRFGAGITGIPFTDPFVLQSICGIDNPFDKRKELSSVFVYRAINGFGGPSAFYDKFLLSSVCPLGFLMDSKNSNYYDSQALFKKVSGLISHSLNKHLTMNISQGHLIILGKKNADFFNQIDGFHDLFGQIHVLEHPRFIMQYKKGQEEDYVESYVNTFLKTVSQP